jgi:hypothetical protein
MGADITPRPMWPDYQRPPKGAIVLTYDSPAKTGFNIDTFTVKVSYDF